MKNFILKFLLFLLPIIVFAYALDVFISTNLKKSNQFVKGEFCVWNDLYEKKVNSEILIMGSSRAWVQVNSTIMSDSLKMNTYNLGIDGHDFWLQNYRFQLAMKQNTKPKIIIQSIDIFTLAKRADLFYAEQFLPYMLNNKELEQVTQNYIGYTKNDYKIPLIRYYGKGKSVIEAFKMAFTNKNSPTRIKGYQGQELVWNDDLENAKKKMNSFTAVLDKRTINLFENYIKECKKQNIKLIFVYSPEYIDGQSFISNRKEMIGVFSDISKKYTIPFIDYSNDEMSYKKEYFYNALHLNKTGADLFTYKLVSDLKKLNEFNNR